MRKFGMPVNRFLRMLLTVAVLLAAFVRPVQAADAAITVNTSADEYGTGAGCALREAIYAAKINRSYGGCTYAGTSPETIVLPAGEYQLDEPISANDPAGGDLDIEASLTLLGAGAGSTRITAAGLGDRVLHIQPPEGAAGLTVVIKDVTISGGRVVDPLGGGGVLNLRSRLTLQNVVVEDNQALFGPGVTNTVGGGITNAYGGTLNLTGVTVANNETDGNGGGVYSSGALNVQGGMFTGNWAGLGGGGVYNYGRDYPKNTFARTLFSGNTAIHPYNGGAAIYNASSPLTLTAVTLQDNTGISLVNTGQLLVNYSLVRGGSDVGIQSASSNLGLTVENSTLAGNAGAGISTGGLLLLRNATLADNGGPGVLLTSGAAAALQNNLFARNPAGSCQKVSDGLVPVIFTTNGYNIADSLAVTANEPCGLLEGGEGDAGEQADPLLAADLADNGGYTQTYALDPTSPAIDRVPADNANCPAVDQRFFIRPADFDCDAGAVEANGRVLNLFVPFIGLD